MSILTYPLGFIGGGVTEFYNGVMENSLRLGEGDSAYLNQTQSATAGNQKTWTLSFGLKELT